MSKVFEKLLEKQITVYVNCYDILPTCQSGFRPGHSCASALSAVVDDVLAAADSSKLTCLILLDFSRAFDTVNHKLLSLILEHLGFNNAATSLITNYLLHRCQEVIVHNKVSSTLPLHTGVPQGSILGPLLFTLYTSKLHTCLKFCSYHLYADDTQVYLTFERNELPSASDRINSDLDRIVNFSIQHNLHINVNKTSAILFGRNHDELVTNNFSIKINNTALAFSKSVRNLGLSVDSN